MRAKKRNPWRGRGLDKRQARRALRHASPLVADDAWENASRPRRITPDAGPYFELVVLDEDLGTLVAARHAATGEILSTGVDTPNIRSS